VAETAYNFYIVHCTVLALRLPGVTVGSYLEFLNFTFSASPLLRFHIHSQALTCRGKFEFHKGLKFIRYSLGSPGKSGEAHPHQVASLARPFVIKFKLHFFRECFSWQMKSRIYD